MIKRMFFSLAVFCSVPLYAQTEFRVDFNKYISNTKNQLVSDFTGNYNLVADPYNGITGGSIKPSLKASENAYYFKNVDYFHDRIKTSICFKYHSEKSVKGIVASVILNALVDSMVVFEPTYVETYVTNTETSKSKLCIATPQDTSYSTAFMLKDKHWYKIELQSRKKYRDSTQNTATLYDLGINGKNDELIQSSISIPLYTPKLRKSLLVFAGINGSRGSGCIQLDNFLLRTGFEDFYERILYDVIFNNSHYVLVNVKSANYKGLLLLNNIRLSSIMEREKKMTMDEYFLYMKSIIKNDGVIELTDDDIKEWYYPIAKKKIENKYDKIKLNSFIHKYFQLSKKFQEYELKDKYYEGDTTKNWIVAQLFKWKIPVRDNRETRNIEVDVSDIDNLEGKKNK